MIYIKLFKLPQIVQVVNLRQLVLVGLQDFKLTELTELQAIKIFQAILSEIYNVQILTAVEPLWNIDV